MTSFLLATLLAAAPLAADPPKPAAPAEAEAFKPVSWAEACKAAEGGAFVVCFWGVDPRPVAGCVVAEVPYPAYMQHWYGPVVTVSAHVNCRHVGFYRYAAQTLPPPDDTWIKASVEALKLLQSLTTRPLVGPGVPAAPTFRHDPDHNCDRCGAAQYVQHGPGPRVGTHAHRCPRCGLVWWH